MVSLPAPFKSACSDKNLAAFKMYSQYACLLECYTNITYEECGCRLLSMPSFGKQYAV